MLKRIIRDEWWPFYYLLDDVNGIKISEELAERYEKAVINIQELNDELQELYDKNNKGINDKRV